MPSGPSWHLSLQWETFLMFNESDMRETEPELDVETTGEPEIERGLSMIRASGLKLNRNDTKYIRELIRDLARRDQSNPADIIDSPVIANILAHEKLNGPQKLTRLKRALSALRYPVLTRAKDVFEAEVKDLKLHPGIEIGHTPYFEDNSIDVRFNYDSPAQLREIIRSLERLADRDPVRDALETAEDSC